MSRQKHKILEVHSEKEWESKPKYAEQEWVEVEFTSSCCGKEKREVRYYPAAFWRIFKNQGYYME